ncbi:MAG: hypothetical protein HDR01_14140 [Lachnospiraceae bacterium]|nr:hypothetical protein [Lachnospiraceae bacterium]
MDVSDVGAAGGYQYQPKTANNLKEEVRNTPDSEKKHLGVIVEISKDLPEAVQQRIQNGERGRYGNVTHRVVGNGANGMASFYGASVTKEQSDKLQSVIKDLEQQPTGNLGDSWNVGAYAQFGLKVSQLSYACKEIGLSDEAAEQITSAYGKQAEEKINKINGMIESVAKQVKIEQEKFYKEHGTPNYRKGAAEMKESLVNKSASGKTSVELNREANGDIYKIFSNLDVSNKEKFVSSFTKAVDSFKNYYAGGEVQIFTGTGKEQSQLDELVKRFHSFLEA